MNIPQGFALGQLGEWKDKWFRVAGRIRFADDESFWDEWCLEFSDATFGWLEHEDGETFITLKKRLLSPVPPWQHIQVGQMLDINRQSFFVMEKAAARITGYEGQLPFPVSVGERVLFADGNMSGAPAGLEWGHDVIEFSVGHIVEAGDLNFRISEF